MSPDYCSRGGACGRSRGGRPSGCAGRVDTLRRKAFMCLGAMIALALSGLLGEPTGAARPQTPETRSKDHSSPRFEIASIKPSSRGQDSLFQVEPNRLTVRNQPVGFLVRLAYGHGMGQFGFNMLSEHQLAGGPDWIRPSAFGYEGYDVEAKVEDSIAETFGKDCTNAAFYRGNPRCRGPMLSMLQALLADRFKLKVRRESKEGPVYSLEVAKGGPKFFHTSFALKGSEANGQVTRRDASRPEPCPEEMACAEGYTSMDDVAEWLSRVPQIGRPVVNQTGLEGGYYLKLRFSRAASQSVSPEAETAPVGGPSGPSVFTALKEQLGLKLRATRGPVETIVIEHIERPSEN